MFQTLPCFENSVSEDQILHQFLLQQSIGLRFDLIIASSMKISFNI